ncbi:UDP-glucose/GDP-mannose dehydrogenase family protein [Kineosporia sp. J2-2]|uniref:UDP-glucose 6-dehydrogenase n=1 Tax=Kineosporia corallincola TaxID=2835133 RepID=A0ABS5TL96_9ACTN|nr:UDP-glucose/GDP-mannose dehydrogenase family protein [Kineosporia corallincola]MBT0770364.1 UDP-glucose/GDP-mannose dehydrogenase family protein [Kineosporia corallincola]
MRLSVMGCGYLGAVHAACMADFGHEVIGVDVDERKIADLQQAKAPFFEPGLPELLKRATESGRLSFTTDATQVAHTPDAPTVHFVCVGTPQRAGEFAADTRYVDAAVQALIPHLQPGDLVVGKSTVPVGTAARLAGLISEAVPGAMLAWNPEFLREGFAVQDTQHPDRIVYGLPSDPEQAAQAKALLDQVYASPLSENTPVITSDYATAELVKTAANAFLATKISFINAMAEVCEAAGADVSTLATAIGHDERIGPKFLGAGLGFGGGCLPKDIRAFMARAGELGADQALTFLREVDAINMRRRIRMVDLAREVLQGSFLGRKVTVLGAAFKPESDDIRDSPALNVAAQIRLQGAEVVVTDPAALENARRVWPDLHYEDKIEVACDGADVVLLLTEWKQYKAIDPAKLAGIVRERNVLDGRNALDPHAWRTAGWTYRALGRPRA